MRFLILAILFFNLFVIPAWPEDNSEKIMLIGIDGTEWKVMNNLLSEGKLPNIKKLMAGGVYGKLRATLPIISPSIWTDIITGKGREKHGIVKFVTKLPGTNTTIPISSNMRKTNALWNILSDNSKTVGIIGWWATWPVENVGGFMVSDRFCYQTYGFMDRALSARETPGQQVFPEGILTEIIRFVQSPQKEIKTLFGIKFPDCDILAEQERKKLFLLSSAYSRDKSYADTGLYLLEKFRPDFFAIYLEGIDTSSHLFWKYKKTDVFGNIIAAYYEYIDEEIGKFIISARDNYTVIICSDHGFGAAPAEYTKEHPVLPDPTGSHRVHGVIIISGKNIKKGLLLPGATVLDITPTILYLMGMPVAEDMDGRILLDAVSDEYRQNNPFRTIPTYENNRGMEKKDNQPRPSPFDETMKERFKSLGYIQ